MHRRVREKEINGRGQTRMLRQVRGFSFFVKRDRENGVLTC